MIRRLRDKGITILMVEHIMEAIMPLANTIVVLSHGEKIAEGQPQSIVHNQEVITAYLGEKFVKKMNMQNQIMLTDAGDKKGDAP